MKNRIVFRAAFHASFLLLVFSVALSSQRYDDAYIKGTVTLSNKPLRSVWVVASQYGEEKGRSLTGDDGRYYISNLSDGSYDIVVLRDKEQIYSGQVNLPTDNTYNIVIKRVGRR